MKHRGIREKEKNRLSLSIPEADGIRAVPVSVERSLFLPLPDRFE
jgi:hypothetical protein